MAERDLELELKLKKDAARRELASYGAEAKQIIATDLSAAEVAERAKVEAVKRSNRQRIDEASRAIKTEIELNKEAIEERKRQLKKATDAAMASVKESYAVEKQVIKEGQALYKESMDDRKRKLKDATAAVMASLKESQQTEKEVRREGKQLVAENAAAEKKAQDDARTRSALAFEEQKKRHTANMQASKEASASVLAATKQMAMFAAGAVGINGITQALEMVVEKFNAVRVAGMRAAQDILDEAGELRQLGSLQGEMGQPSQQLLQQLEFRTKTLQTAGEARSMTTEAMSSGFGAINAKLVSEEEFRKHLETAGQLQKMTGAAPEAVGKMSGILPMVTGKASNTAGDLDAMMERLYEVQKLGGFKDYGQAATQFAGSAEYVMKGMFSAPTAQALLSAFAVAGQGDTASERLSQVTTAVSAGVLRNRGIQVNPDYAADVEKSAEYFKGLGVTTDTSTVERIQAVVRDLIAKEDETKAKGKEWNPFDYLLEKGFINVQARESLAKLAGVERTGGQLTSLLGLGNAPMGASQIGDKFGQFKDSEPWAMQEAARIDTRLKEFQGGLGGGGEGPWKNIMYQRAFAALGGKTAFGMDLDTIKDRSPWDPRELLFGQRAQLEREIQRQVLDAARAQGVDVHGSEVYDARTGLQIGERKIDLDQLYGIAQRTREAGGGLVPGADPAKTQQTLEQIRDALHNLAPPRQNQQAMQAPVMVNPPMVNGGLRP